MTSSRPMTSGHHHLPTKEKIEVGGGDPSAHAQRLTAHHCLPIRGSNATAGLLHSDPQGCKAPSTG